MLSVYLEDALNRRVTQRDLVDLGMPALDARFRGGKSVAPEFSL